MANPYDVVRYPPATFSHAQPASLGALAALLGKRAAPPDHARVLEIGCGEGVNLLSMALGAPKGEFVGLDLAETPIARARAAVSACGLANVHFHVEGILDLDGSRGRFDYIV